MEEEVAASKEDTKGEFVNKKDKILEELSKGYLKNAEAVRNFESRIFILETKVAEFTRRKVPESRGPVVKKSAFPVDKPS